MAFPVMLFSFSNSVFIFEKTRLASFPSQSPLLLQRENQSKTENGDNTRIQSCPKSKYWAIEILIQLLEEPLNCHFDSKTWRLLFSFQEAQEKKKKNLFEVAQFLPNWGHGYHMAKTHWTNVSYQITKINLYKDGRHGKAWGVVHKDGLPAADAPKKISGVHKRCWRYIPHLSKPGDTAPSLMKPSESAPKPEAQLA